MDVTKDCAALAAMLKSAYEEVAREKEASLYWYKECEKLKKRIADLEPKCSLEIRTLRPEGSGCSCEQL